MLVKVVSCIKDVSMLNGCKTPLYFTPLSGFETPERLFITSDNIAPWAFSLDGDLVGTHLQDFLCRLLNRSKRLIRKRAETHLCLQTRVLAFVALPLLLPEADTIL